MAAHFSWEDTDRDFGKHLEELEAFQKRIVKSKFMEELQCKDTVAAYDLNGQDIANNSELQRDIYNSFHELSGCVILKNVFTKESMDAYNLWCEDWLANAPPDKNGTHTKQASKFLINDIIGRLSKQNPELFMALMNNDHLSTTLDILLGFSKYGSATCHWIQGNGARQMSHVDYPIHVGSGKFWEGSPEKMQSMMARHQINSIMKFFSCQVIIASDAMDVKNGSTEVVPASHLLKDLDLNIHNKEFYNLIESKFHNVTLGQGDLLIFNRALLHRGGENTTENRRNALIMQCIYSFGVGQEIIDYDGVVRNLRDSEAFQALSEESRNRFLLRFKFVYPLDVTQNA